MAAALTYFHITMGTAEVIKDSDSHNLSDGRMRVPVLDHMALSKQQCSCDDITIRFHYLNMIYFIMILHVVGVIVKKHQVSDGQMDV